MKSSMARWLLQGVAVSGWVLAASAASAQGFNGGLPAGWTCVGTCGTLGADGDVTLSGVPTSTAYGYVVTGGSTADGKSLSPFSAPPFGSPPGTLPGLGGGGIGGETNGSRLQSSTFAAAAGDALEFKFNYISSDGTSSFIEYGWALVRDASDGSVEALLFTGRTNPAGPAVPGFDLPAATATVNNGSAVNIVIGSGPGGGPLWSPLGSDSGNCFGPGCGYTGWIDSDYQFAASGNYILEFGVINWGDQAWDAGFAFDGITVAGKPIDDVTTPPPIPEPSTYALMLAGLAAVGWMARRRRPD
jgi:PEP-CTERM motif